LKGTGFDDFEHFFISRFESGKNGARDAKEKLIVENLFISVICLSACPVQKGIEGETNLGGRSVNTVFVTRENAIQIE